VSLAVAKITIVYIVMVILIVSVVKPEYHLKRLGYKAAHPAYPTKISA